MTTDNRQDPGERKSAVPARREPGRAYPVDRAAPGESDSRFTYGIVFNLIADLERRGYPTPTGVDIAYLMQDLFRFIYGGAPTAEELYGAPPRVTVPLDVLDESRPVGGHGKSDRGVTREWPPAGRTPQEHDEAVRAYRKRTGQVGAFETTLERQDRLWGEAWKRHEEEDAHRNDDRGAPGTETPGCGTPYCTADHHKSDPAAHAEGAHDL